MSEITLSIVSHGHGSLLVQLLADLDSLDGIDGTRVIVTLNLGEERFEPDYEHLDVIVVRNATPRGFGANHNAAFRHCVTPWFAVLNPDLRITGGNPFPVLLSTAARLGHLGVIAPRIENSEGGLEDAVRTNLTPLSLIRRRVMRQREPLSADWVARPGAPFYWLAGMCLVLAADPFREIGGFDERYFLYCEDYDLCARLYAAGYELAVDSQVLVVHDAQRDSHRSRQHLRWHLASLAKVWTSRAFWRVTLDGVTVRRKFSKNNPAS